MTSDYSLSDISAVTGGGNRNNGGLFSGDGSWFIIILFLFAFLGWGGNGAWGGGMSGGVRGGIADNYVLATDFATIERKLDGVNNGLCDGFYAMNTGMLNGFAGVTNAVTSGFYSSELSRCNQQAALMQQLNNMAMQSADCCCQTQRAIEGVNYNLATQSCETRNAVQNIGRDLIDNQNANARAILDALTQQRIEAKDEKIAAQNQQIFGLQLAASQAAQNNYLLGELKPCPKPTYITCNPFTGQYGGYNAAGCGCGC